MHKVPDLQNLYIIEKNIKRCKKRECKYLKFYKTTVYYTHTCAYIYMWICFICIKTIYGIFLFRIILSSFQIYIFFIYIVHI